MAIKNYSINAKDEAVIEFEDGKHYSYPTQNDEFIKEHWLSYMQFCIGNNKPMEGIEQLTDFVDEFLVLKELEKEYEY